MLCFSHLGQWQAGVILDNEEGILTTFRGIWPALATPLDAAEHVDVQATKRLVEYLIGAGVHGLYVGGGTGEGVLLERGDRQRLAEAALSQAAGRIPVIVHVGAVATADAVFLAKHAAQIGAAAVAAVPPFYYSVGLEAIKDHYRLIAETSELPLFLYYIPGTTGVELAAEQIWELCQIEGVAGFKYSSFDLFTFERVLRLAQGNLNTFSGPDQLLTAFKALGVDGAIGSTYNILPAYCVQLYNACEAGDLVEARALQARVNDVIQVYLKHGGIPALKEVLRLMGLDCGYCKRPLGRLTEDQVKALATDLDRVGFWEMAQRP